MNRTDVTGNREFSLLADWGLISPGELDRAETAARARGVELEKVLLSEYGLPRHMLLRALSEHYGCAPVEYDERLPIPPELLAGLDGDTLSTSLWIPVIKYTSGKVVIAARNPRDPAVMREVTKYVKADEYEFRVALDDDIQWYIQDFLHAKPGLLIGTERTGLAYWRNTMAQWRTRLACYKTDLGNARTGLSFVRWGLGTVAMANTLLQNRSATTEPGLFVGLMVLGLILTVYGLPVYLKVRRSRMSPPGHQTLVEVTSATLNFLENYHCLDNTGVECRTKGTMLARMGDNLYEYCTILNPSPSSKVRTMYARDRNVLAAQRTIAACYRAIYSRARTGIAFIRTGISFLSVGVGVLAYYGLGLFTSFNLVLGLAGLLMIIDGVLWYIPVRREQAEIPRSIHGLEC